MNFNIDPYVQLKHPEWCKNATIYEVNVRQYTKEGTFKAFESHLPRLKDMGVDILWLMPIHPIGKKNRKGSLGSYYSVRNYFDVNTEFGSLSDFKHLVSKIHKMGMYVIIDWVANHCAWDNPIVHNHPDWCTKDHQGHLHPTPWFDWHDVVDLDYSNQGLRTVMAEALTFWVKETNIDGYRCDVAGFVPIDFWENVRSQLEQIKPVFMLAEWETRDLHKHAFDATYSWSFWDNLVSITRDGKPIDSLIEYIANHVNTFPENGIRMLFTENHDKNSWEGTTQMNFGPALDLALVLAVLLPGMPLIYNGQEAGLDRPLSFFEKDEIIWENHPHFRLIKILFQLKHDNKALWNARWGGSMERIINDNMKCVLSFFRKKDYNGIVGLFNLCDTETTVTLSDEFYSQTYTDLFTGNKLTLTGKDTFTLKSWGFKVFVSD